MLGTKEAQMTKVPGTLDADIDEALLTYIETESADQWFALGEYGFRKMTTNKAVHGVALIKLRKLIVLLVRKQNSARFCKKQMERRILHLLQTQKENDQQDIPNNNA